MTMERDSLVARLTKRIEHLAGQPRTPSQDQELADMRTCAAALSRPEQVVADDIVEQVKAEAVRRNCVFGGSLDDYPRDIENWTNGALLSLACAALTTTAAPLQADASAPASQAIGVQAVKPLTSAIQRIVDENEDFRVGMPGDWAGDPLQDAIEDAHKIAIATLAALSQEPVPATAEERAAPARQPVADDIVEKLFVDLRGRRYLKWIFSEHGDKCLIERAESGEWVTGISLDVQDEIRAEWRRIAASSIASSEPELRAEIVRLQAEVKRWQDNWDANVQEMSERFRAVNIAKVIEASGKDIIGLADRAEAAESRVEALSAEVGKLTRERDEALAEARTAWGSRQLWHEEAHAGREPE